MKRLFFTLLIVLSVTSKGFAQDERITSKDLIPEEKNPAVAFIMSAALPGLGQMYNNQVGKGYTFLGTSLLGAGVYAAYHEQDEGKFGLIILGVSWLYSLIDATVTSNLITNESRYKKAVMRKQFGKLASSDDTGAYFQIDPYFLADQAGLSLQYHF